jgi:poly-gamma-glutamate capsule biosynthesis protein CapA/YwtB (metallophosphatase superfamily)
VERVVSLFLCGDVMLGRGVDQILPHPGDPALRERCIRDARRYVELAESVNGQIPSPVDFAWPWGDALATLNDAAPDLRLINLETSITRADDFASGKAVHYRMNPDNVPCLARLAPDVCALANNHVLDVGRQGLADTLDALRDADLRAVGAGRDRRGARARARADPWWRTRRRCLLCHGVQRHSAELGVDTGPGWRQLRTRPVRTLRSRAHRPGPGGQAGR